MGNHKSIGYWLVFITIQFVVSIPHSISQQGSLLFHHLTQEDGLSDLNNQYVYKDSKGFIWISSIKGLNRFDGTRIQNYMPDPDDSTSIFREILQSNFYEDTLSNLWFSTWDGINCYERKHDRFSHYSRYDKDKKPIFGYYAIHLDSLHQLWIISEDSIIYTFNILTKEFHQVTNLYLTSQRAAIIADTTGNVRKLFTYSTNQTGTEEIDFDANGVILSKKLIWTGTDGVEIKPRKILSEGDSVLWIAGPTELIKYNLHTKTSTRKPINNILAIDHFNDSLLLVSIDGEGVWEYNKKNFSFGYQYISENDNSLSLLSNSITYISRDKDNGFWLCSEGLGLDYAYMGKKKFNFFNPISIRDSENAKFSPNGFIEDSSGRVICSTESGGLFILDKNCRIYNKIERKDDDTKQRLSHINKIFRDRKQQLWVSSYLGLSVFSENNNKVEHLSDRSNHMIDGIELADGRLIFAGSSGLFEAHEVGNEYILNSIRPEQFNKGYTPIQQDKKGRIWMSEELKQYIILDPSFNIIAEIPITGICSPMIETEDGQSIWIASPSGLYNIDSKNLNIKELYNEKKGLPTSALIDMLMDEKGHLWLSSNKGLIDFDPETKSSRLYTYEDGLPSSDFNRNGAYRSKDGEMWFASARGITKFRPGEIHDIQIKAIPQITSLLINGQPPVKKLVCENTSSSNITEIQKLTFSFRENTLAFVLNSLEFSAPKKSMVMYKMENFDVEWDTVKSGSEIRYHLPSKSFRLLVKAANSDGVFNDVIRSLEITVTPPFYQRWWFISLVSLAVLGLAVYIVYLNFSKKLELQKVRLRLYENLHDDVGSRLTSIVLSTDELILQDHNTNPKLQHIGKVSRSIVDNMRRLVWAIDPENDSMNSLVQKIRYDRSLILDEKVLFHVDIDSHLSQMIVPGEVRYQVTSIINEALNNISKYANAQNVWIQFSKKDGVLSVVIKDDGRGFKMDETYNDKVKSSGYGLGNMQKRVSRVKGTLSIHSKPGEGTIIEVKIPFR